MSDIGEIDPDRVSEVLQQINSRRQAIDGNYYSDEKCIEALELALEEYEGNLSFTATRYNQHRRDTDPTARTCQRYLNYDSWVRLRQDLRDGCLEK